MAEAVEPVSLPRVLIVDDSRIVRATLIKHLKGHYEFREEADGEAGWTALQSDPEIQIVLTDLSMPKLDGFGLIERIRSAPAERLKRLPVVLISGDEDESSRAKAKTLGATDFIAKGTGAEELLARVGSLVKLAHAEETLANQHTEQIKDPVSGLFTSGYIAEQAEKMVASAIRHKQPGLVLMIGVDGLPALEQKYGAKVSEQIALRFGQLLATKVRREDSLGHYKTPGTYLALSEATPAAGGLIYAERLREAVAAANVTLGGQRLAMSVSVGLAELQVDQAMTAGDLLRHAMDRLNQAREAGGNQVGGFGDKLQPPHRVPTIDNALHMLQSGREADLAPCSASLALRVLPILALADQSLGLGLDLPALEKKLRDQAQKEKEA